MGVSFGFPMWDHDIVPVCLIAEHARYCAGECHQVYESLDSVFRVNGIYFVVLLPICRPEKGWYTTGRVKNHVNWFEHLSGRKLIHQNELYCLVRDAFPKGYFPVGPNHHLQNELHATLAYESSWTRYYDLASVRRLIEPLIPKCEHCGEAYAEYAEYFGGIGTFRKVAAGRLGKWEPESYLNGWVEGRFCSQLCRQEVYRRRDVQIRKHRGELQWLKRSRRLLKAARALTREHLKNESHAV